MNITRVFIAASVVALSGCECGGSPGPDGGLGSDATAADAFSSTDVPMSDVPVLDASEPLTPEGIAALLATTLCEDNGFLDRCFPEVVERSVPCELGLVDSFVSVAGAHWRESIAAGRVTLNPAALEACLAAFDSSCVADPTGMPSACRDLFVGSVPADGTCLETVDCSAGLVCRGSCAKTCTAPAGVGAACNGTADCAAGLDCAGTCVARAGHGEACSMTVPCASGLACHGGTCSRWDELTLASVGSPCSEVFVTSNRLTLCADGAFCESGTCRPWAARGEACGFTIFCDRGLSCQAGVCASLAGAGEPCTGTLCAPGYFCSMAGRCARRVENGASCGDPGECRSGTCRAGVCAVDVCG